MTRAKMMRRKQMTKILLSISILVSNAVIKDMRLMNAVVKFLIWFKSNQQKQSIVCFVARGKS